MSSVTTLAEDGVGILMSKPADCWEGWVKNNRRSWSASASGLERRRCSTSSVEVGEFRTGRTLGLSWIISSKTSFLSVGFDLKETVDTAVRKSPMAQFCLRLAGGFKNSRSRTQTRQLQASAWTVHALCLTPLMPPGGRDDIDLPSISNTKPGQPIQPNRLDHGSRSCIAARCRSRHHWRSHEMVSKILCPPSNQD